MAITIKSAGYNNYDANATDYVSAHEDIWHIVESDNAETPGFKYLFDIYKNGVLLTRVANSPYIYQSESVVRYGLLNVGNIIRSSITVDVPQIDIGLPYSFGINITDKSTDYWFTDYDVRYGEICGTTTSENLASGSYRAYNTYYRHPIHKSGTRINDQKIFLTNRPQTSTIYKNQPIVLTINGRCLPVSTNYDLLVNNALLESHQAFDGISFFSLNYIDTDATFQITTDDDSSEIIYFKLKCSKYTPYTLIFLNSYGGWDSFTFINGIITTENEKKRYEKNKWVFNNYSMFDYTTQNETKIKYEGKKTYGVKFKTKMKLTSDILNTDEYKWLFELIVSPIVYLADTETGTLYPVQITDSNYEMKNSLQNKTETLDINIDVYDQNTQYR